MKKKNELFEKLIEAVTEEMWTPDGCMVFISDSYYDNIVDVDHLRSVKGVPIYTLFIYDSDVFSPPKSRIKHTFMESKKSGCYSYVILIANGLQVAKMLKYMEGERLLNTRGKFLLMYDTRILVPEMSYIWNRIVNVIFLRKYMTLHHKSGSLIVDEWYSLETVDYPVPVKKFVITSSINKWTDGYLEYDTNLFPQKAERLDNQKVKVAVFEHFPAVFRNAIEMYQRDNSTNRKTTLGVEFELLLFIAKEMDFRPEFYKPDNIETEKWGEESNGTYNGLLGEAIEARATFYLGEFHNTPRHQKLMDLSTAYNTECLTFLTPELLSDTSWKLLIVPFTLAVWITVLGSLIFGSATVYFFSLFYKEKISYNKCMFMSVTKNKTTKKVRVTEDEMIAVKGSLKEENAGLYLFTEVQNSALYMYSMLLQVSLPMLPRAWAVRVFIGCWWIYCILISVAYRASLTASLANPIEKKTIDTVSELAKSNIRVGGWINETKNFFEISDDIDVKKIADKFEIINNETEAIELVANGLIAYYESTFALQQSRVSRQLVNEKKTNETGKIPGKLDSNLHVMKECVIYMPVSLGMDKNSPLKPRVDFLIRSAIEAGLVSKWLSDVTEWSKIAEKKHEDDPVKAFVNFKKLQGALVALGIGYIIALMVFVAEIIHFKYVILKDPAYDKYHLDEFYKIYATRNITWFKSTEKNL